MLKFVRLINHIKNQSKLKSYQMINKKRTLDHRYNIIIIFVTNVRVDFTPMISKKL